MPNTTKVVISNPTQEGCTGYNIMLTSDLRQVGDFLKVLQVPSPIKLTAMIYLKYC